MYESVWGFPFFNFLLLSCPGFCKKIYPIPKMPSPSECSFIFPLVYCLFSPGYSVF